jgi:hypothetical protein
MLTELARTDRLRGRSNMVSHVSELSTWRTAALMLELYPETCCLVAAHWADSANTTGPTFIFRFWGRVERQLMELLRQSTISDTVN